MASEMFYRLQQGTIDAAENAIANLIYQSLWDNQKRNMDQSCFGYGRVYRTWNQPDDLREDFVEGVKAGAQDEEDYLVKPWGSKGTDSKANDLDTHDDIKVSRTGNGTVADQMDQPGWKTVTGWKIGGSG